MIFLPELLRYPLGGYEMKERVNLFREDYFDIHYIGSLVNFNPGPKNAEQEILTALIGIFKAQKAIYCIHQDGTSINPKILASINVGKIYLERYVTYKNHFAPFLHDLDGVQASLDTDQFVSSDLERLEFLNDFLKPQNICHSLIMYLRDRNTCLGHISFYKDDKTSAFSEKDLFKAQLLSGFLGPYLRHRYFNPKILGSQGSQEFLKWMIEALPDGVIVIDSDLFPICWNTHYLDIGLALGWEGKTSLMNVNWPMLSSEIINECHRIKKTIRNNSNLEKLKIGEQQVFANTMDSQFTVNIGILPECRSWKGELDSYYFILLFKRIVRNNKNMSKLIPYYWKLTPREKEIVQYLCDGLTNKEISGLLCVSVSTVATHIRHIYQKTGTGSRARLIHDLTYSMS